MSRPSPSQQQILFWWPWILFIFVMIFAFRDWYHRSYVKLREQRVFMQQPNREWQIRHMYGYTHEVKRIFELEHWLEQQPEKTWSIVLPTESERTLPIGQNAAMVRALLKGKYQFVSVDAFSSVETEAAVVILDTRIRQQYEALEALRAANPDVALQAWEISL